MKQRLAESIQLADRVTKAADKAILFKQQCEDIKSKAVKLSNLLRQAVMLSSQLYEQPALLILFKIERVLNKALSLLFKKRIFIIIWVSAFTKTSSQLQNSARDISWLLHISSLHDEHYLGPGLPPMFTNDLMLCFIWEQIASLSTGKPENRSDAAVTLALLAHDSDHFGKMIIEEGGVGPLLKLMKEEGNTQGQENAVRAISLLKVINSANILVTNATMHKAKTSFRDIRMESTTFADDVSCSRSECFLCE